MFCLTLPTFLSVIFWFKNAATFCIIICAQLNWTKIPLNFMSPEKGRYNIIIFSATRKALLGKLRDGIDVEFFGKHGWEAMIKLTKGFFKALLQTHLGGSLKNAPKNANRDEFSSQLFCFQIFFNVIWVINKRNIIPERLCMVWKLKRQQSIWLLQLSKWPSSYLLESLLQEVCTFVEKWCK